MAEYPVKSTYGRMERTFWLVEILCRIMDYRIVFHQEHDYLKNKLK